MGQFVFFSTLLLQSLNCFDDETNGFTIVMNMNMNIDNFIK